MCSPFPYSHLDHPHLHISVLGDTYSTHVPMDLAPGDYLVCHKIIGLQLATTEGGAKFYPSCSQIRVSGNKTGVPQVTVAFPGAYSDTDPGILVPDVSSDSGLLFLHA